MPLQRQARRIEGIEIFVLEQDGNTGLPIAKAIVDLHLIGIRNIPHQIGETLRGLPRTECSLVWRRQLNNRDHIAAASPGIPALYQLP